MLGPSVDRAPTDAEGVSLACEDFLDRIMRPASGRRWKGRPRLVVTTGDVVPGGMGWVVPDELSPPSEAVGLPQLTSRKEGSWLTLEASTRTRC